MERQEVDTKRKILLIGGSGQVGTRIRELLSGQYEINSPTHMELDIVDLTKTAKYIELNHPDVLINMSGITNAEKAMENPSQAFLVNAFAPAYLAHLAGELGINYLQASTDYVYYGRKKKFAYNEADKPRPLSIYGRTKLLGEQLAFAANPEMTLFRVMLPYSSYYEKKLDIARAVVSRLSHGQTFAATTDQNINPIFVDHLVDCVNAVVQNPLPGRFHLGARDYTTPFEFAQNIAQVLDLDRNLLVPTTFAEFSKTRPAKRPQNCWLDTTKFRDTYGEGLIKTTTEGLTEFAQQVKNQED